MTRNLVALGCELDRMRPNIRNDSKYGSGNLAVESQGALIGNEVPDDVWWENSPNKSPPED
jgi:hypothetical protein